MKLKGAHILLKMLKEEGVDTIFGYPGGSVIDIYDAMMEDEELNHILVRHEQGAIHAADGYARASGKVGVCLVTSGPGATNTVTGIASAYMDSIPVVVFTGQVPTQLIGNDAFQEVDIVGITRPCTKHSYLVKDAGSLARIIKEAFHIARSGRPGPVLVDLPKDVINAVTEFKMPGKVKLEAYNPTYKPNIKQLHKVVDLIKNAQKPVIFSGGGVSLSQAHNELTEFARKTNTPVTSTLMGLGGFPGTDPLWLGMLGMHGTFRANMAVSECDLLISAGVRFDDRVTGKIDEFAPHARIVQIDIDPTSIQKNIPVHVPVVGDCKISLARLNELLEKESPEEIGEKTKPWLDQIEQWKKTTPLAYEQKDVIKPQYVIET
ncbi:MAG: biosynthetic-type acetolactate synthase large subunit, partial [bacterium]